MECMWLPISLINPHINSVVSLSPEEIKFKGHCYLEPNVFPLERILNVRRGDVVRDFHVRILDVSKKDEPFRCEVCEREEKCDPEENHLQLFPCEVVSMKFEILTEITSGAYYTYAVDRLIKMEEGLEERNRVARETRMKKESEKLREVYAKMDYS